MSHRPPQQEYVVCIDSRNRNLELYPDPNDFKLDVNFSRGLPVTRISIGSIELALPQYIIEERWSRLYIGEGLALIVNSESDECLREFVVREWDGTIARAVLPIWLNPITDVDTTDPTAPVFTTAFEHALELRGQWDWGAPIRLVSTELTDPALIELTVQNPHLTVLSPTRFRLSNVTQALVPGQGYVHAPAIANPAKLADMVTAGLNLRSSNLSYRMEYDGARNQFCLKLAGLPCALATAPDAACGDWEGSHSSSATPTTILSPSTNCLSFVMGFGCTDLPLPPGDKAVTKGVCGEFCYQCMSYLQFTPGNYNVESFPAEFATQANRFYFEPTCGDPAAPAIPPPALVFSDECGACHVAIVPFGKYSPESLAQALQNAMNGFSATNDYSVGYDAASAKFTFRTISGALFGLEFDDPRNTGISFLGAGGGARELRMPERLGFAPGCYRGEAMYMSNRGFHVPTKGCRCTSIPERLLSNIYVPLLSRQRKEFGVNACRARIASGTLTDQGNGMVLIETALSPAPPAPALPQYAHGMQPEDVINVRDETSGSTYQLVVSEVLSATSFLAEISGVAAFAGATDAAVCVSLFGPVVLNLYFGSLCNVGPFAQLPGDSTPFALYPVNTMRAEITGFPPTAILWDGPSSLPFFAPNVFNLDPPPYLLLQLVEPNESRFIQHRYQNDTLTNLLAKIIAYPPLRQERAVPQEAIFQGLKIIKQLHFRVLTPTHQLYNFRGLDWSATLIFVTASVSGSQACY